MNKACTGYYFSQLSTAQKALYNTMRTGIESFSREIHLPFMHPNKLQKIFDAILRDNPLIFYTSSYTVTGNARECKLFPKYKCTPRIAKEYTSQIMRELRAFDGVKGKSEIEKELFVHDYCLKNFKYDYSFGEHAYTVLGIVLNGTAVCEGISKFVQLALDYLGVKNILVKGEARCPVSGTVSPHSWNIVKIAPGTFHLDVTFNMTISDRLNRYDYFNLSDEEIKKDHILTGEMPKCNTSGDYYTTRGMAARSPAEMKALLNNSKKRGEKSIVLKLQNVTEPEAILNKVTDMAARQFGNVEVRYNPSQMVFEIFSW